MPYPNEHAARVKAPGRYERIRRHNNRFGQGIHALFGIRKQDGKEVAELQAIRFDKTKFTAAQAKAWLKEHGYGDAMFEAAGGEQVGGRTVVGRTVDGSRETVDERTVGGRTVDGSRETVDERTVGERTVDGSRETVDGGGRGEIEELPQPKAGEMIPFEGFEEYHVLTAGEVQKLGLEKLIKPARGVDIKELTKDDPDPFFVFARALSVTTSKNGRRYYQKHLQTFLKELPLYGYRGHPPVTTGYAPYRGWVTVWIGGVIQEGWLYVKGYVPPEEDEHRKKIARSIAVGKPMTVSIWAQMELKPRGSGVTDVGNIVPISIDWADPGEEGVEGAQAVGTSGEGIGTETEMKKEDVVERHEIIRDLTAGEVRRDNPPLVETLGGEAVKTFKESKEFTDLKAKAKKHDELAGEMKSLKEKVLKAYREKLLGEMVLPTQEGTDEEKEQKAQGEALKSMAERLFPMPEFSGEIKVDETIKAMDEAWVKVKKDVGEFATKQGLKLFGEVKDNDKKPKAGESKKKDRKPGLKQEWAEEEKED